MRIAGVASQIEPKEYSLHAHISCSKEIIHVCFQVDEERKTRTCEEISFQRVFYLGVEGVLRRFHLQTF